VTQSDRNVNGPPHQSWESRLTRRASGWDDLRLDLLSEEQIIKEGPALLMRGLEAVGGTLWLTNSRLAFRPHALNFQRGKLDIDVGDWVDLSRTWTTLLGVPIRPNAITLRVRGGKRFKLAVYLREAWFECADAVWRAASGTRS